MRREAKKRLAQRKTEATARYLRALSNAQAHREDIENSLMMLHKAARKGKGVQFTAPATRWLSMYLDLLVTRLDLLGLNLSPKVARSIIMLGAPGGDAPKPQPRLTVIEGEKPTEPPTA